MIQRSGTSEERARPTEQEQAGREANARELAEARRTAVAILSAVASVIVAHALKVSSVGLLAVFAGFIALVMVRVGANRMRARRRDGLVAQDGLDAGARGRLDVEAGVTGGPASPAGRASAWQGLVPVYGGLAAYFIVESGHASSLDAFAAAMATVVAVSLVINCVLRLTSGVSPEPRWWRGGSGQHYVARPYGTGDVTIKLQTIVTAV